MNDITSILHQFKKGLLSAEEVAEKIRAGTVPAPSHTDIDYSRLYTERGRLLRLAYSRSDIGHNEAFTAFCEKNK